jgi:hypothetical protein
LYRRAGSTNKQVVKIEGGTHSGMRVGSEDYRDALDRFIASTSPNAAAAAAAAAGSVARID